MAFWEFDLRAAAVAMDSVRDFVRRADTTYATTLDSAYAHVQAVVRERQANTMSGTAASYWESEVQRVPDHLQLRRDSYIAAERDTAHWPASWLVGLLQSCRQRQCLTSARPRRGRVPPSPPMRCRRSTSRRGVRPRIGSGARSSRPHRRPRTSLRRRAPDRQPSVVAGASHTISLRSGARSAWPAREPARGRATSTTNGPSVAPSLTAVEWGTVPRVGRGRTGSLMCAYPGRTACTTCGRGAAVRGDGVSSAVNLLGVRVGAGLREGTGTGQNSGVCRSLRLGAYFLI
jgi:hypothetical protein